MEELLKSLNILASEELIRANSKFPAFSSTHESYAVLLEEIEESEFELNQMKQCLSCMWSNVRHNDNQEVKIYVDKIGKYALRLAAEAIQVKAMCEKYKGLEVKK